MSTAARRFLPTQVLRAIGSGNDKRLNGPAGSGVWELGRAPAQRIADKQGLRIRSMFSSALPHAGSRRVWSSQGLVIEPPAVLRFRPALTVYRRRADPPPEASPPDRAPYRPAHLQCSHSPPCVSALKPPSSGFRLIAATCALAGLNFESIAKCITYAIGKSMHRSAPIASQCMPSAPSTKIRHRLSTFIADREARQMPLTRMAQQGVQRILCPLGRLHKPARGNECIAVFLGLHPGA